MDIFTLHPEQGQIFRLWQIYIENVNPLLKVTHIPTLQARIVDATNDIVSVKPVLAALMFSIYCVSILSLTKAECFTLFGISKEALSKKYQFGCQQALLECGFTRLSDRDSLTALHLYLVSRFHLYHCACLIDLGFRKTRCGSPVSVCHVWCRHSHSATHGA